MEEVRSKKEEGRRKKEEVRGKKDDGRLVPVSSRFTGTIFVKLV